MKLFYILRMSVIIMLLAFAVVPVFAQDATPEPFPTSTPTGPVDPSEGEIVTDVDTATFDLNTIMLVVANVVTLFQALVVSAAVGGLASALTNAGKALGLVKDGQALNVVPVIGIVLLAVIVGVILLNPDAATQSNLEGIVTQVSSVIGGGTALIVAVFGLFGGAKLFHKAATGYPVIGKSFENEAAKAAGK
jgi:hypothetical protein